MAGCIFVDDYMCRFFVKTRWGSRLEFVLQEAEDAYFEKHHCFRHKRTYATGCDGAPYTILLWDMLKKEFSRSKTIHVPDYCAYGDISFVVSARSPQELERAVARCDKVVQRWVNKYRVNYMKDR